MALEEARWQLVGEKLEQKCEYLLASGLRADCFFMVGSETKLEVIQADKLALALASPVFMPMFYGGFSERDKPIVRIPDISPEAFRVLLQYIYDGNIKIDSFDVACDMLYGAKKYMLPHLEKECNRYICSVLESNNVCQAYEIAHFFDDKTIMDECLKIIRTNTKEILNDNNFVDVEINTLITVLSLDQLNVDSELDLFNAVARYAEAKLQRQTSPVYVNPSKKMCKGLESSTSDERVMLLSVESSPAAELDSKPPTEVCSEPTADKQNLKGEEPTIRTALQKIRFLTMTEQEFAKGPALSNLLTEAESSALLLSIRHRNWNMPMPAGFSECQNRRQLHSYSSIQMCACMLEGCFDHTINALKSGDPSQVKEASRAAANVMQETQYIQTALEKGILDALVPALTGEDYICKQHAADTIYFLCIRGSPAELCVLAEGAALQPYCRLLAVAENSICYWVLHGLTKLLVRVQLKTKLELISKLQDIGVPQLLLKQKENEFGYRAKSKFQENNNQILKLRSNRRVTIQQKEDKSLFIGIQTKSNSALAEELLETYFSGRL